MEKRIVSRLNLEIDFLKGHNLKKNPNAWFDQFFISRLRGMLG